MQEKPVESNPWPKRLLIAGGIMLLIGTLVVFSNSNNLLDSSSPLTNNIHNQVGTSSFTIEVDETNCYKLVSIYDDPVVSATVNDPLTDSGEISADNCLPDFRPQDNEHAYVVIDAWQLENGTYEVNIQCQEDDCSTTSIYMINANLIAQSYFSLPTIIGCTMCSLAAFIIPLSGILISIENRNKKVVMLNTDGSQMQFQSIDEMNRMILEGRFQQTEGNNQQVSQSTVPDPFAPEQPPNPQQQVSADDDTENGYNQVRSGQLLTTNQIYALMQGDLEKAKDITMKNIGIQQPKQNKPDANYASKDTIDAWDSGGAISKPPQKSNNITKISYPKRTEQTKSDKWKEWDES